jgi:hypothetical protein
MTLGEHVFGGLLKICVLQILFATIPENGNYLNLATTSTLFIRMSSNLNGQ